MLSEARRLAAESISARALDPQAKERVHLLALASLQIMETPEGIRALRSASKHGVPHKQYKLEGQHTVIAFSLDGKFFASKGHDHTVLVKRVSDNTVVARIKHDASIRDAIFSPNVKYLLSWDFDGTARVTNLADTLEIARATHESSIDDAYFSPDSEYFVSCKGNAYSLASIQTVVTRISDNVEVAHLLYDKSTTSIVSILEDEYTLSSGEGNYPGLIRLADNTEVTRLHCGMPVRFSADGQYVAAWFGSLSIKRVAEDEELRPYYNRGTPSRVAFSLDGQYLASGDASGLVNVTRLSDGEYVTVIKSHYGSYISALSFSPDSRYLAIGSSDRGSTVNGNHAASVTQLSDRKEVARVRHDKAVSTVAISEDGQYLLSGGADNRVRITRIFNFAEDPAVKGRFLGFGPAGENIYTIGGDYNTGAVRILQFTDKKEITRIALDPWQFRSAVFSPDGKYLVSGGWDHGSIFKDTPARVRVTRVADQEDVAELKPAGGLTGGVYSPQGQYFARESGRSVYVTRMSDFENIASIDHEGYIRGLKFSSDGKYLVSGSHKGDVRLTRLPDGEEMVRVTHKHGLNNVDLSPDGVYIAIAGKDSIALLTRVADNEEVLRIRHRGEVSTAHFSADGQYLATGSSNGLIRVIRISNHEEALRVRHDENIAAVAFSPDGRYLATGSSDGLARVTRISDHFEVARVEHGQWLYDVSFSPDGQYMISQGSYGSTIISDLDNNFIKAQVCKTLPGNFTARDWEQYFGDLVTYDRTCPNLPIHPTYFQKIETLIEDGDVDLAQKLLEHANQIDSSLRIDVPTYITTFQ